MVSEATAEFEPPLPVRTSSTGYVGQALAANNHGFALATEVISFGLRGLPAYAASKPSCARSTPPGMPSTTRQVSCKPSPKISNDGCSTHPVGTAVRDELNLRARALVAMRGQAGLKSYSGKRRLPGCALTTRPAQMPAQSE